MIFPFIITNQTQISNLWFMIYDFPFQNHKHKHNHKLTWLRRTKPKKKKRKKKKKKKNGERGGVRSWGHEAMSEEDEMCRGLCDSARLATAMMK